MSDETLPAVPEKPDRSPKRGPDTRWQKGECPNPGVRSPRVVPNGGPLPGLCRAKTLELVARVFAVAMNPANDPRDTLAAIFGLLDRGWGKPKESVDIDARVEGSGVPIIQIVRYPSEDRPEGD